MIGEINRGNEFFFLDIYQKRVRVFAFVEILEAEKKYFTIGPLEVYFDDLYGMEAGKQILGMAFSANSFYTPKSINNIRNPYKKQIIRKLFGVR